MALPGCITPFQPSTPSKCARLHATVPLPLALVKPHPCPAGNTCQFLLKADNASCQGPPYGVFSNSAAAALQHPLKDLLFLWPLGMDQVNVAALLGVFGWPLGFLGAAGSLALNTVTKRTLRLPEPLVYGLWFAASRS